ncbi:hypothetical protein DL240_18855 [Lujinxingia litoralis]|uniref:histidine kinase n=1 Tax=Lujinxingia litoralis TaxID=2211119 RepID=A0A328C4Z1_9DELT|nr:ATP-binding protein [Lujinxingia litoralis]RAL20090.1 hypothetical protein DL240_18855 [Lujinxingia litoralis]
MQTLPPSLASLSHAPTIEGVRLHKPIGRGADSVVILASRGVDTVAVKTSREPGAHLSDDRRRRFLREGCLLACLTHPALPRIYEVGESHKTPYIVLEYVKGETLQERVTREPLSGELLLALATELADALAQVHDHGLIHRDIHPANVLLDDDHRPRLIDFGLAADVDVDDAQRLEGTLHYLSPEQGGMLERLVDHRSDLYSLGALLYFAATGEPPFEGKDPRAILSQHATAPIPDPRARRVDLDPEFAGIIRWLMAKDPSDRPGSAAALLNQLQHLGQRPTSMPLDHGVHELVGRRAELQQLLEAWDRSQQHRTTLAMLEGPSGSGKSRLMHELVTRAGAEGAGTFFITIQAEESHPFAPLQRLFDPICDYIDRLEGDELRATTTFFLDIVDHRLDALHLAVPRLALQLDQNTAAEASPGLDLRSDVVYDSLAAILRQIARVMKGALIAIDNAQWLDDATERVLQRLDLARDQAPLLILLGADDSRQASPRTNQLAGSLRSILHTRITLAQLSLREVDALIRARLAGADVDVELVERIFAVSAGNAYAVESFIRTLLDAAVLRPFWGRWVLDAERLQGLDLPDDMAELLHFQLDQLPEQTREVLSWIALFGVVDHPEQLASCAGLALASVEDAFAQASLAGLLRNLSDQGYTLIHNSLRQRLLQNLDPDERARRHQEIARTLDDDQAHARLFDLARHYALGQPHLNPARALEINHRAGKLAEASFAYLQAFQFLRDAARIAHEFNVPHPTLDADLGRIAARTGNLVLAQTHLTRAIEQASDPYLRAELRGELANVDITNLDIARARQQLQKALAEIGETIPRPRPADLATSLGAWALGELATRQPRLGRLLRKPLSEAQRRHMRVLSDLYDFGSRIGYFTFEDDLLLQIGLRQHDVAVKLQDHALLARTHSLLGFIAAAAGRPYWSKDHAQRAIDHARTTRDRTTITMVNFMNAMVDDLSGRPLEAAKTFEASVMEQGQWLDAWEYASGATLLAQTYALRGHHRRSLSVARQAIRALRARLGEDNADRQFATTPLAATALVGMVATADPGDRRAHEDAIQRYFEHTSDRLYYHALFHHALLVYSVERHLLDAEVDRHIEGFESLPMNFPRIPFYLRSFYIWKTWLYLLRVEEALDQGALPSFANLDHALAELDQAASVPLYRAYHALFSAFAALHRGRLQEVPPLLDQARHLADQADIPLVHFEIARCFALLHRRQNSPDVTLRYLRHALQLAQDQGWAPRLRRLRADFSEELREATSSSLPRSSHTGTRNSLTSSQTMSARTQQHFEALLRIHQVLSDLGTPQTKLNQVLDELIAIFGAQRGFFFHVNPDDDSHLLLEASRHVEHRQHDDADLVPLHHDWAEGLVQQVFATGRPLVVHNVREGARWDQEAFSNHLRSAIAVPMISRGKPRGVVYLDSSLSEGVFAQSDLRTLQGLTNSLAILLEAARTTRLEAEVARASERSASLLEHATSAVQLGMAIVDAHGNLSTATPTLHAMAEPWGSLSRWWARAFDASNWKNRDSGLASGLNLKSALADIRTPDNQRRVFELTDTGAQHQLHEYDQHHVFLIRDVTSHILASEERARLNQDLELATEEALSANRAKSTFLANMSHELRTPLNAIIGYAEMLLEEHSPDEFPDLVADLDRIQVAGKHLLRLVSDILDLSKIEAGHIELAPHTFNLRAMIDDVAATARQLVESNHNTLSLSPIPDVTLFNDETRLRQILLNLLGNAAKFTEDGDVALTITLIDAPTRADNANNAPSHDWLAITVSDSGIGMTPDQLERLFEAFYQADQRSISRHGGTGLGLTITRRFCDLMGGSIHVESTPGKGTSFTIKLPIRIDPTLDPDLLALQSMVE